MLDPRIRTLITVCETGSFTRAAETLNLTQPAVSQQIRQMEQELDVHIFNRCKKQLILTSEGELVLRYARRMDALYQNLRQRLKNDRQHVTHIRVAITHTAESNAVAEALAKLGSTHEGVTISLISDTIKNCYEMLENYEVDLAVVEGHVTDNRYNALLLDTDQLVLAVATDHPLAHKSLITIEQLRREKLILRRPNSGTRNLFVAHLESNNMTIDDFNVILEVDNVATIKDLVRRNFGVSILPKSACLDELKKGKMIVLPVENLSMIREINILYRPDFEHMNVLQDLMRIYLDTVRTYL